MTALVPSNPSSVVLAANAFIGVVSPATVFMFVITFVAFRLFKSETFVCCT